MHKKIVVITIIIIFFSACRSVPVEEINETPPVRDYYNETKSLIYKGSDSLFWSVINDNRKEFPDETEKLLSDYSAFQKDLIQFYIEKNDAGSAQFHFNNLKAVPENKESFITREWLERNVEKLKEETDRVQFSELFSSGIPMEPINRNYSVFRESLAEIHLQYTWETIDGIERSNNGNLAGSGFLITPRHILTAFHVVDVIFDEDIKESDISVRFGEKIINDVKLLSWDSLTDLAVLELPEVSDKPYLYHLLSDENQMRQGDLVYALGHPFGYTYTFSQGVVSSVERKAPEWGQWMQIDASVGPGSSGGLLIGGNGKVAGLIVAGLSGEELNFAVPSTLIIEVIDSLILGTTVRRPWNGLLFSEEKNSTVLHHIFEESPLISTELKSGDRLTHVNGEAVESLDSAKSFINDLESGNIISLRFSNEEGEREYIFKMMRRPDYALYNKISRMDIFERVFVSASVSLDKKMPQTETLGNSDDPVVFSTFPVSQIDENSFLYGFGVRKGDRLGLIDDDFKNNEYILTVMHIPRGKTISQLKRPGDMIITLAKDKYNEYIF